VNEFPWKKVLFISPHADDVELGCGGTISRLNREGVEVQVLTFCATPMDGHPYVSGPPTGLEKEQAQALATLAVAPWRVRTYFWNVRSLRENSRAVLEMLRATRSSYLPDAVFVPASWDTHQDHEVVHREALRAFRGISIFGYHFPWNTEKEMRLGLFVGLAPADMNRKLTALGKYESQLTKEPCYFNMNAIKGLLYAHGLQARCELAEGFEVIRAVL
jgi:N-acetylglucosamine malate deacetylase 1